MTPGNTVGSYAGLRVIFGIIAALAFLSNGALIYIIIRKRAVLCSSYNVLILSLALTDMITGQSLLNNPSIYVYCVSS